MIQRFASAVATLVALLLATPGPGRAATITLQNDGFDVGQSVACMGGFAAGEGGAVTLGPLAEDYRVTRILLLFCGASTTQTVTLNIYREDGNTDPGPLLQTGDYDLTGADDVLHALDLAPALPVAAGGSIRVEIVVNHDNEPGIARDGDGTITPGVNWLNSAGLGGWVDSAAQGLTGDWVIRAEVETADPPGPDGGVGHDGGSPDGGTGGDAGGAGCSSDLDCAGSEVCRNGNCYLPCPDTAACGGGSCENGFCVGSCQNASDCLTGEVCDDGICQIVCSGDPSCPAGEVCDRNVCVPARGNGNGGCALAGDALPLALPTVLLILLLLGVARLFRRDET